MRTSKTFQFNKRLAIKNMRAPMTVISLIGTLLFSLNITLAQSSMAQQIGELNRQIATKVTAKNKTTIAVVEFADLEGNVTNFGRFMAEELITRLHETEKFKVIERQLLNQVIKEQKLTLSGIVDPASAKQLGRLLGVDAIVSGSITDLGKTLRVNARLISTETGEIFAVAAREFVKDQTVINLMASRGQQANATSSDANSTTSPQSAKPTVKASLYTFVLDDCRLSGSTIVCDLTITNNDRDRVFSYDHLVGGAGMIDDLGGTYMATSIRIANRNGFDDAVIVSNVPTKSRIIFDNVSSEATKIASLKMQFNRVDQGILNHFKVEFRDVVLSK
jgi:TolB-like protein